MSPGTGNGQPSSSTLSTAITWSALQPPSSRCQYHIVLESAAPTKPPSALRVVEPAHLEQHDPGLAKVDRMLEPAVAWDA